MKTTLASFLILLTVDLAADPEPTSPSAKLRGHIQTGWAACDVTGITVPTYQYSGDLVTLDFPTRYAKAPLVSFVTEPVTSSLVGKTITATVRIEASPGSVYSVSSTGGWSIPPNMRIYFTTDPRPYRYSNADRNETGYWWSDVAFIHLTEDVVNGYAVSLTATFTAPLDPAEWSDALGHYATDSPAYTSAFLAAANAPAQVGFAFGSGSFFDTGVGAWIGTITLHVTSYAVQ